MAERKEVQDRLETAISSLGDLLVCAYHRLAGTKKIPTIHRDTGPCGNRVCGLQIALPGEENSKCLRTCTSQSLCLFTMNRSGMFFFYGVCLQEIEREGEKVSSRRTIVVGKFRFNRLMASRSIHRNRKEMKTRFSPITKR